MATIASLLIMAVGAAVAAYGAYSQAQAQKTQIKQQQYMYEAEAEQARQAGVAAARRQRAKDKAAMESFGARAAMAGVVAHEGSALLTELDFAEQSEFNALNVQHGYQVEANRAGTKASFARWQAGRISPAMAAGTSLIGSAAGAASGGFGGIATGGGGGGAGSQTGGGLTSSPTSGSAYSSYRAGERTDYARSWVGGGQAY
jgi:hypothetical protein